MKRIVAAAAVTMATLLGGILLERFGPGIGFGLAAMLTLSSLLPVLAMSAIPAGAEVIPAPSMQCPTTTS